MPEKDKIYFCISEHIVYPYNTHAWPQAHADSLAYTCAVTFYNTLPFIAVS